MYTFDIIIPCYNEEKSIRPLYEKLIETLIPLDDIDSRFIFINDGSTDKTLETIKEIVRKDRRCVYVSFSRNFGKEAAILAGMKFSNADFTCIIDADLQHPPELIPEMLSALIDDDFDVAAAKRKGRKSRGLTNKLSESFYSVFNKLSDVHMEQNAQDFRIMKRKVVNAYLCVHECNRFSRGLFSWIGYKTKWFEHEDVERTSGKSKWSMSSLIKYAIDAVTGFSDFPLRIPTFCGFTMLIAWLIKAVYCIVMSVFNKNVAFDECFTVFVGGLILISLGIVGEYLAAALAEAKHRPDFIITETNVLFDEHARSNYTFDVVDVYDDDSYRHTRRRPSKKYEDEDMNDDEEIELDESDIPDISEKAFYYEDYNE